MFDGCAPIPDMLDVEPPGLLECIAIVWMVVALTSLLLPRPYFVKLFKIAYPFMPDNLE